jgi:hypothetical protein
MYCQPPLEVRQAAGRLQLLLDGLAYGEGITLRTRNRFSLTGEGLCIGYDDGDAVSSQYQPRFEFTGGTIHKVVFDVADDAYIDLEQHLHAAMARD